LKSFLCGPDKSGTQIESPLEFSAWTFDHCFGRNLLTISPIDPILLPLASYFCWDHVSAIINWFHHILAQRLSVVLNLGHRSILTKNFIQLLFTPSPPLRSPPQPSKVKLNAYSMCAYESRLHTYHTENRYIITNVTNI
jgi:hypothetical protein